MTTWRLFNLDICYSSLQLKKNYLMNHRMCNYPAPMAANRTFARDATISSTIKSPHKHLLDDRPSGDLHIK
jgi:hypothetical protein